jgi:hypothetical protein
MTERVWYNWPKGYIEGRVAWYVILWRLPFIPIYFSTIVVACVCVLLTVGSKDAMKFWRDNL